MNGTKLLEAWCHWIEVEKDPDEDMKLMAADIRAVLKELKSARELVSLVKGYMRAMDEEHTCSGSPSCHICERIFTECSWSKEHIRKWLKEEARRG
jgi:hypothetical protein